MRQLILNLWNAGEVSILVATLLQLFWPLCYIYSQVVPSCGPERIVHIGMISVWKTRFSKLTDMLPDLSRTKHTILCPICSNEKVGVGGWLVIGVVFLKSSDSLMTSHVLRRLHLWFCKFGASLLWFCSVQNSTT
jgi:hypothetical protein